MKKCILISAIFYFIFSLHGMETNADQDGYSHEKNNAIQDLDGVLLHEPSTEFTERHKLFSRNSFYVLDHQNKYYMVPAYCTEYLKCITSRYNLSFFSAGIKERNESAIQDMWLKVFGTSYPESMLVLSREDLINKKKDITKIGSLDNSILIDDQVYRVLTHQLPNFLRVSGLNFWDLAYVREKHGDGNRYNRIIESALTDEYNAQYLLAFYKLLYVVAMLDMAAEQSPNVVEGLNAIPSAKEELFFERIRDLQYYKRGYQVLSTFAKDGKLPEYFPEIEKYFSSELQPNYFYTESSSSVESENDSQ